MAKDDVKLTVEATLKTDKFDTGAKNVKDTLDTLKKDVTTTAKFNVSNKKDLANYKESLAKIAKKVNTTASFTHKQADISVQAYKKKLDALQKNIKTTASFDARSAHTSIDNLSAKLRELKSKDYSINVAVNTNGKTNELNAVTKALTKLNSSNKDYNINVGLGNLDKISSGVTKLKSDIGSIGTDVKLNISSDGISDTVKGLKEIQKLLKSISKNSNVRINSSIGDKSNESSQDAFKTYQAQLADLANRAQRVHQAHPKDEIKQLQTLQSQYAILTRQLQDYSAKMGTMDYSAQIKLLTPVIQALQRYGVIAKDNIGIIEELNRANSEWARNSTAGKFQTYRQQAVDHRNRAQDALEADNLAEYEKQLRLSAEASDKATQLNNIIKQQIANLRVMRGEEQANLTTLASMEREWRAIAEARFQREDVAGVQQAKSVLDKIQNLKTQLSSQIAQNAFKGLDLELKNLQGRLSTAIKVNADGASLDALRKEIIEKTKEAVQNGLASGNLSTQSAIGRLNKIQSIAQQVGDTSVQDMLQKLSPQRVSSTGTNQSEAQRLTSEYNTLRSQAVQAINAINTAWQLGNGASSQERALDRILDRMRAIKQEQGTFNYNNEANVYKDLASSVDKGSRAYDVLIDKIKRARTQQAKLNTDAGDARRGGVSVAGAGAYITRFLGRSAKGYGSFAEALAQATVDMDKLRGSSNLFTAALGRLSIPTAVMSASFTAFGATLALANQSIQTFGNLLMSIGQTIYNVLKPGIELYKQQQSAIYSFTAGLMNIGVDKDGNKLSRNDASGVSKELVDRATLDAEMSAFSLEDLLKSLQGTLPVLMNKGMSLNQAYEVNKGVAAVAKMLQLAPNQILQETRDLAQGSITARGSQVAGALGVTNEDVKGKSSDEIFNLLMEKFQNYTELLTQFEDTPLGRIQQLEERVQNIGKIFVDTLGTQFKGLAESIIEWTGQWKDKRGNSLNSLTGKWEDANGNEVNNSMYDGTDGSTENYTPEGQWFQLSEPLEKARDALKEIVTYLADAADELLEFIEDEFGISDPIELAKDAVELLIDGFKLSCEIVVALIGLAVDLEPVILSAVDTVIVLATAFKFVGKTIKMVISWINLLFRQAIAGIDSILDMLPDVVKSKLGITVNHSGDVAGVMSAYKDADEATTDFKDFLASDVNLYTSFKDFKMGTKDEGSGFFGKAVRKPWQPKEENGSKSMSDVMGVNKGSDNSKEAEKARKAAIKESQRQLKEHRERIKNILDDTLDRLKDLLEENEIAYKEGFASIREYYTKKADLDKQEAEARLEAAKEELDAISRSKFNSEYEKLTAQHKVEREIAKYTKQLGKAQQAQVEVAKHLGNFTEAIGEMQTSMMNNMLNFSNLVVSGGSSSSGGTTAPMGATGDKLVDLTTAVVKRVFETTGKKLNPGYVWGLLADETARGTSRVFMEDNNPGGITWNESWGSAGYQRGGARPSNEGGYYVHFNDLSQAAKGEADVLSQSRYNGIESASSAQEFLNALKSGNYMETNDPAALNTYVSLMNEGVEKMQSLGITFDKIVGGAQNATNAINLMSTSVVNAGNSISATLNSTFSQLVDKEMPHLVDGCVEAVVRLGAGFSDVLANELANDVNNVSTLESDLKAAGIQVDTNTSLLQPGDILVVNGGGHVVMVQDTQHTVGNSSYNNPNTPSHSGIMQQELAYWQKRTDRVIRTGSMGLKPNISSGNVNLATADKTKLGNEAYEAVKKQLDDYHALVEEISSDIFGSFQNIEAKLKSLFNDKYKLERSSDPLDKRRLGQLLIRIRQKTTKIISDFFTNMLDFNLSRLEETGKNLGVRLAFGNNISDELVGGAFNKYSKVFNNVTDITKAKRSREKLASYLALLTSPQKYGKALNSVDELNKNYIYKYRDYTRRDDGRQQWMDDDVTKFVRSIITEYDSTLSSYNSTKKYLKMYKENLGTDGFTKDGLAKVAQEYKVFNDRLWDLRNNPKTKPIVDQYVAETKQLDNLESQLAEIAKISPSYARTLNAYSKYKPVNDDYYSMKVGMKPASADELSAQKDKWEKLRKEYFDAKAISDKESDKAVSQLRDRLKNLDYLIGMVNQRPANQIAALEKQFAEYERQGNVREAENIRKKILEARAKLYSIFDGMIGSISSRFDGISEYLDSLHFTPLQREDAEEILKRERNRQLAIGYRAKAKAIRNSMSDESNIVVGLNSKLAKLQSDVPDRYTDNEAYLEYVSKYPDKMKQIAELQSLITIKNDKLTQSMQELVDVTNKLHISENLSKIVPPLKRVYREARDALENGLVDFLSHGIIEANSFKQAFGEMLIGILQEIQNFLAKQVVKDLMNNLFGTDATHGLGENFDGTGRVDVSKVYAEQSLTRYDPTTGLNIIYGRNNQGNIDVLGSTQVKNPYTNYKAYTLGGKSAGSFASINKNQQYSFNNPFNATQDTGVVYRDAQETKSLLGDRSDEVLAQINSSAVEANMSLQTVVETLNTQTSTLDQAIKEADTHITNAVGSSTSLNGDSTNTTSNAKGHATGGYIAGLGTATSDSIPAMLSDGEYVVKASSVKKYGTNFLNAINSGTLSSNLSRIPVGVSRFAGGGAVAGSASQETARGLQGFANAIGTNVSTTTNMNVALVGNQEEAMAHFMRSPRGQRIMLDFSKNSARFSSTGNNNF